MSIKELAAYTVDRIWIGTDLHSTEKEYAAELVESALAKLQADHQAEVKQCQYQYQDSIMTLGIDITIRDTKIRELKKNLNTAMALLKSATSTLKAASLRDAAEVFEIKIEELEKAE